MDPLKGWESILLSAEAAEYPTLDLFFKSKIILLYENQQVNTIGFQI